MLKNIKNRYSNKMYYFRGKTGIECTRWITLYGLFTSKIEIITITRIGGVRITYNNNIHTSRSRIGKRFSFRPTCVQIYYIVYTGGFTKHSHPHFAHPPLIIKCILIRIFETFKYILKDHILKFLRFFYII